MCFKRKPKPPKIATLFDVGDNVYVRYRGFRTFARVKAIRFEGERALYDVQVGGECTALLEGLEESELDFARF